MFDAGFALTQDFISWWWSGGTLRFLVQVMTKIEDISKREKNSEYTQDKDNGLTFLMHVFKK